MERSLKGSNPSVERGFSFQKISGPAFRGDVASTYTYRGDVASNRRGYRSRVQLKEVLLE